MVERRICIDHVTIAASRLEPLQQAFTSLGLQPDYGGPHSNGVTHMALIGFDDGSYIDLIATLRDGEKSPWWGQHISRDGGPCAWAALTDDLSLEVVRLRGRNGPYRHWIGRTGYQRARALEQTIEMNAASKRLPIEKTERRQSREIAWIGSEELARIKVSLLGAKRGVTNR